MKTPNLNKISLIKWLQTKSLTKEQEAEMKALVKNKIWIGGTMKKTLLSEMSTEHLQNCIRCLNGFDRMKVPYPYTVVKEEYLTAIREEIKDRINR